MAKHVLTNAEVLVNAVDLCDHVSSVTIETTRPEVDVTAMGATYQEFIPGLADATVTINFFQDFAAAKTHATLAAARPRRRRRSTCSSSRTRPPRSARRTHRSRSRRCCTPTTRSRRRSARPTSSRRPSATPPRPASSTTSTP